MIYMRCNEPIVVEGMQMRLVVISERIGSYL